MADRKTIAARLLLEKAILDELQDRNKVVDSEARSLYESGDADSVKRGDVLLGRVHRNAETVAAKVEVNDYFLRWVRVNHPEQIDQGNSWLEANADGIAYLQQRFPAGLVEVGDHETVHSAYVKAIEAAIKKAKGKWSETWTDPDDGEERTDRPPFVSYGAKPGSFYVSPSGDAVEIARTLLTERLPELEP